MKPPSVTLLRVARPPLRSRVLIVAGQGGDAVDIFRPIEVLNSATMLAVDEGAPPGSGYDIEVVSGTRARELGTIAGVRLEASRTYREFRGEVDTVIVAPIQTFRLAGADRDLIAWLREVAQHARRVVGLCGGAFLLGHAGLLRGRRATTHWALGSEFARAFPDVALEPDSIYVRDGKVWTSAGATAAMDLSLALVEEDLGPRVARATARFLVLFLRRPGGQSQFSLLLSKQFARREPIRELQGWILDHLGGDLSVDSLAGRAHMSPRNFRRVFLREIGTTPAKFVEQLRIDAARRLLEDTTAGIESIAEACGFGSADHLRAVWGRELGVSPAAYRGRFASTLPDRHESSGIRRLWPATSVLPRR